MVKINRPKIGVGVLVKHDNKFLLLKRRNAHGHGTWAPPGGHLELGESVLDCAKREVLEETNITIKNERILTITEDIFDAQKHYITIWVVSDYDTGVVTNNEPGKCEALEWRLLDDLTDQLFLSFNNLLKHQKYLLL